MSRVSLELQPVSSQLSTRDPSLSELGNSTRSLNGDNRIAIEALPPVDRGRKAWTYLALAFLVEGSLWGIPLSYGVFQAYYSSHEPFSKDPSLLSLVGTVSTGLTYMSGSFMFPLMDRYPRARKPTLWIGYVVLVAAYLSASFATTAWQLVLTQGILSGTGVALLYTPTFIWLGEWFVLKRGFAGGIMFAGTGAAGLIAPLVIERLLDTYGHRTTLMALAIFHGLALGNSPSLSFRSFSLKCIGPLLPFLNGRLPATRTAEYRPLDTRHLKTVLFGVVCLTNFVQALSYFIPLIYLPCELLTLISVVRVNLKRS